MPISVSIEFGWVVVRRAVAQWLPFYALVVVATTGLLLASPRTPGLVRDLLACAFVIPTVAVAAQLVDLTFPVGMRVAMELLALAFVTDVVPETLMRASRLMFARHLSLVNLFILVVVLWAMVKLSLSPAVYAMNKRHGGTMADAIRTSWSLASAGTWWFVFVVVLAVTATVFSPTIVMIVVLRNGLSPILGHSLVQFVATLIVASATALSQTWLVGALFHVGFAKAMPGDVQEAATA